MRQRRQSSTKASPGAGGKPAPPAPPSPSASASPTPAPAATAANGHSHPPEKAHEHGHDHQDAAGIFHVHDHAHDAAGTELVIDALKGKGDRGSRVTLLGLASNVVLTAGKGVAGWFLNSASLIADAGHSLSDLLGDFVVLASWSTSRKEPSSDYPYGYGKFETLGTVTVSLLLIGGALAIGYHSWFLLLSALEPYISTTAAGSAAAAEVLQPVLQATQSAKELADAHVLDPNAAWFALASVVVKEWMFRLTKKVADDEGSSVLMANAYHHRSDAYTSAVALVAILGTWAGVPALDPIGGLGVSALILQQGGAFFWAGVRELLDAGVTVKEREALAALLVPLIASKPPTTFPSPAPLDSPAAATAELRLLAIRNVRAVRSGALLFVDLTADVPRTMTMREAHEVEAAIRSCLMRGRKEIKEVRVHLHAEGVEDGVGGNGPPC